jgi:tetratricopeptide (TPR) repeat protein
VFGFAAFWCYAIYDDRRSRRAYAAALVLFFLSLAGKPVLLALPLILLGYAWWRRGTVTRADRIGAAPFFVMSVLMGAIGTWYQTARIESGAVVHAAGFAERLAGAGWAAWFYAYKALVPIDLAFVYPRWSVDAGRIVSHLPNVALLLLFVTAWSYRASWGRAVLAGGGFFLLSLAPALGFVNIGFWRFSLVGDHYQYQSIIGIIALVVAAADRALTLTAPPRVRRRVAAVSAAVVLALLGTLTWRQSAIYESEEHVWLDTIAKNPAAWMPRNNLGNILFRRGRYADAVPHYLKVLELNPDHTNARANLAATLAAMNDLDGAIRHWSEAVRREPDRPEFTRDLAMALKRAGRNAEALALWQAALARHPNALEPRVGVAAALFQLGRYAEAESHYRAIVAAAPDNAGMHTNLALTLARQGRLEQAAAELRTALRIDPGHRLALRHLGDTLLRLGRRDEAVPVLQQALRIDPADPELLRLLRSSDAQP